MSSHFLNRVFALAVLLGCFLSTAEGRPTETFHRGSRRRCCFVDLFCSAGCNRWGANHYSKRTDEQTPTYPVLLNDLMWAARYLDEMTAKLGEVQRTDGELDDNV